MIPHRNFFAVVMVALAIQAPCWAAGKVYMTEAQAFDWAFPDSDRREAVSVVLSELDRASLAHELGGQEPPGSVVFRRFWKGNSLLGHAFVQEVMGKHEPITFITVLDPEGKVLKVAVMVYRETRGGEVAQERWLKQFAGKHAKDGLRVGRDVVNYAGATISSHAIAGGVRRACRLAAHLPPAGETK